MASGARSSGKVRNQVAPGTPPPTARKAELRVVKAPGGDKGPGFRAVVSLGPTEVIDVTGALTGPLAHALWQLRGGVDISNWVDAERLLDDVLGRAAGREPTSPLDVVIPKKRGRVAR